MDAATPSHDREGPAQLSTREIGHTMVASFLGWALDAYDFTILILVLPAVASTFHRSVADLAFTLTVTLMMRPVGALIFGWIADRYGRRLPLMLDIVFYSVVEILSGFAPGYTSFLILRALYGIGLGGEWGVGAALAMEAVPVRRRGLLSGLYQTGWALGYMLAALGYLLVFPRLGWRPLFFIGGAPALLTIYIRAAVPESPAWDHVRPDHREILSTIRAHSRKFIYLVAMMTMMSVIAHGSMDLYPTFLERERGLTPHPVATITLISNVGAIIGGVLIGYWSDFIGRRRAMAFAALLGLGFVPLWIFSTSFGALAAGAFMMQLAVQGAWGVVPAHLAELSPPEARGLFAGLTYQMGVLFSGIAPFAEALMARRITYGGALALVTALALAGGAAVIMIGRERKGAEMHAAIEPLAVRFAQT